MGRQTIVDTIVTAIAAIPAVTVAESWLERLASGQSYPCVSVEDRIDTAEVAVNTVSRTMNVQVKIFTSNGATTMSELRSLMNTVAAAVGATALDVEYAGSDLAKLYETAVVGSATMQFFVQYEANPFEI